MASDHIAGRPLEFLTLSVEHYVAGRFSANCGHAVAGHQFHHPLELLFKAGILSLEADDDRQRAQTCLKHDAGPQLLPLWVDFKKAFPQATNLSRFDGVVAKIDHWEEVRYLEFVEGRSNVFRVGMLRPAIEHTRKRGSNNNEYELVAEEVDEVYTAAIGAMQVGADWVRVSCLHSSQALYMYLRENLHQLPFSTSKTG